MIGAALCTRSSSDLQSAASIEDQFQTSRDHSGHAGRTAVKTCRDAAISRALRSAWCPMNEDELAGPGKSAQCGPLRLAVDPGVAGPGRGAMLS